MRRIMALLLGILVMSGTTVSAAQRPVMQEEKVALLVRETVAAHPDPVEAAMALAGEGLRVVGFEKRQITFVYDGRDVRPVGGQTLSMGADLMPRTQAVLSPAPAPLAGEKADLTMTLWLYEWRRSDGSYREQAMISGSWSSTEYWWLDDPADVIDIRWIVGDIVYLSAVPFDGVQNDQHTQGIASFTVDDQIGAWDLFVNFRPVSSQVYGRYTNIFLNYHHTWWGGRLSVQLGAGPTGSTGSITIQTDARTWTEGTGLAFEIGSGESGGPVTTGGVEPE